MPLLDHFHPSLSQNRHWEAFHGCWAASIADRLNRSLPEGYFAEAQVHGGPRIEVDIATVPKESESSGGVATLTQTQKALAPAALLLPAVFPPEFTIHVIESSAGPNIVAAIELVSPANKDREEARRAFTSKCATYLHSGIGLIVLDIVTNRISRPFEDLFTYFLPSQQPPDIGDLFAASYRPQRVGQTDSIEVRMEGLNLGSPLPQLPLFLDAGRYVFVDFEIAYEEARQNSRLEPFIASI